MQYACVIIKLFRFVTFLMLSSCFLIHYISLHFLFFKYKENERYENDEIIRNNNMFLLCMYAYYHQIHISNIEQTFVSSVK